MTRLHLELIWGNVDGRLAGGEMLSKGILLFLLSHRAVAASPGESNLWFLAKPSHDFLPNMVGHVWLIVKEYGWAGLINRKAGSNYRAGMGLYLGLLAQFKWHAKFQGSWNYFSIALSPICQILVDTSLKLSFQMPLAILQQRPPPSFPRWLVVGNMSPNHSLRWPLANRGIRSDRWEI